MPIGRPGRKLSRLPEHLVDLVTVVALAAAVFGLAIGSFLNVAIYRLPRHESLLFPASHCPKCDTLIKARHNVPVLGWLVLRGKCAACRAPISLRYPLVEFATGLLFGLVTLRIGISAALPAALIVVAAALTAAMIDLDRQRIPGPLLLVAVAAELAFLIPKAATSWSLAVAAVVAAALCAVCAAARPTWEAVEARLHASAVPVGTFAAVAAGLSLFAPLPIL